MIYTKEKRIVLKKNVKKEKRLNFTKRKKKQTLRPTTAAQTTGILNNEKKNKYKLNLIFILVFIL